MATLQDKPSSAVLFRIALLIWMVPGCAVLADAQQRRKPNVLVIFSDDIGWFNVGAYNMGMMGYRTPNIDRMAHEGMLFRDYYAELHCGTRGVHHRPEHLSHGIVKGRTAGLKRRAAEGRSHDRRTSEAPGLYQWTVWQESSG
jgi:hypothetical protein